MQKLYKQPQMALREYGVTLIELMVAMVISLFMIGAVLYVVQESQVTYRHNDSLGQIQEGGRIAIELVAYDARMAGYFGCVPNDDAVVITALPPPTPDPAVPKFKTIRPVTGMVYPSAGANVYVNEGVLAGVPGSDVFLIRKGGSEPQSLVSDLANTSAPLIIASNLDNIQVGDIVMVTDCDAADIFRATSVAPGGGGVTIGHAAGATNESGELSKQYGANASVMSFSQEVYYLRDSGRMGPDGTTPIISLYRRNASNATLPPGQELIEGVTNMVVTYGLDINDDQQIDQYVPATAVPANAWRNVLSARIEVLVAGEQNIARTSQPYYFDNTTISPPPVAGIPDRRLRQSFSATAAFRNSLQ